MYFLAILAGLVTIVVAEECYCRRSETCCPSYQPDIAACCPYSYGVCCPNGVTCCPQGFICSSTADECLEIPEERFQKRRGALKRKLTSPKRKLTKCDENNFCVDGACCRDLDDDYSCCPFDEGVCCKDKQHCCNKGEKCTESSYYCIQKDILTFASPTTPSVIKV
ncbi:hypothetical protein NPIL_681831 [Nephila pilipes]|uniref:Granulins domain-containing protein n=1 Tax=Nephila pilipes TaxID=299642 RepID=A0A8X6U8P6_NEPPI|nr:hypothetical protein NPIL_681831 [Nephila pilipes]